MSIPFRNGILALALVVTLHPFSVVRAEEALSFFESTADFSQASVFRIQAHLNSVVDYLRAQDISHLSIDRQAHPACNKSYLGDMP